MAENDFLVWAANATSEIYTQSQYAGLATLGPGVAPGIADALQANKTWRQASVMAAVIAQFIQQQLPSQTVIDDGTTATILASLTQALAVTHGEQSITSSGTWTVPAGVYQFIVRLWGTGGGGGGAQSTGGAGGGGAGGHCRKLVSTTPGTVYTITLGTAGTAGSSTGTNGGNGGSSTFTGTNASLTANGGSGGGAAFATGGTGAGGAGSTATGGDLNVSGGSGQNGLVNGTLYVGGSGGASPFGGSISSVTIGTPFNGAFPGGGGGGSANGQNAGTGGNAYCLIIF